MRQMTYFLSRSCSSTMTSFSLTAPTRDKAHADICQCKESAPRRDEMQESGGHVEDLVLITPLWCFLFISPLSVVQGLERGRQPSSRTITPMSWRSEMLASIVPAELIPRTRRVVDHTRPVARSVYYLFTWPPACIEATHPLSLSLLASPLYRFWYC
jgi:hypothetical protein